MVSLQQNRGIMTSGAQYMDDVLGEARTASDSLGNDDEPILSSSGNDNFKKLKTIPVSALNLVLSISLSITVMSLVLIKSNLQHEDINFIISCLRAAFWVVTYLLEHLRRRRHSELRINGYHEFHRSVLMHEGFSLMIVSAWNSLLLLAIAETYVKSSIETEHFYFFLIPYQVLETLALVTGHSFYINKVYKFNKNANFPDALMGTNSSAGTLGLMQPGGNVGELLEKQADLIAYLKDHNVKLNQKLHQMQLNTRTSHLGY